MVTWLDYRCKVLSFRVVEKAGKGRQTNDVHKYVHPVNNSLI